MTNLSRRGFFGRVGGALAAAVALPSVFTRERPITLGLNEPGTYRYKVTFYDGVNKIETPMREVRGARCYRINRDGSRTYLPNGIDDGRGL